MPEKTVHNSVLVQNGFYSKEPVSLSFVPSDAEKMKELMARSYNPGAFLYSMDDRMLPTVDKENLNVLQYPEQSNNKLYKPNAEMLNEIQAN